MSLTRITSIVAWTGLSLIFCKALFQIGF